MPPSLFAAKSANVEKACMESAKSSYTRGTYASNTYIRDTCIGNVFSAISACIKGAGPNNTSTEGAGRKNAYIRSICTIKYSRIHLQSFSILEIKLFNLG